MDGTRFIVAGSFIDGSGADVRRHVFLAVKDGRISAIGPAADLPENAEALIDDFSHCTVLPALVDCSVSLSLSPSVAGNMRLSVEGCNLVERKAMLARHISYCHAYGVLGVADSDNNIGLMAGYLDSSASESIIDIRSSGSLCRGVEDCPDGGDFIKIGYCEDIGAGDFPEPLIHYDALNRILKNKGARKAVVVANGRKPVEEALDAGCDAVEQGYGMGEENLRKMAKLDVLWIPSVLRAKNGLDGASSGGDVACRFSTRYVAPGKPNPHAEAFWKKMLAEQLAQLRLARELGVKTAVGTGAGSVGILHGESMVEEMKLFIKAGYSLADTICCASETGAGFFGMEKLGALSRGRQATFLISRGTVKQLPRKLSYLEGIYVDGAPSRTYHKNPVKSV